MRIFFLCCWLLFYAVVSFSQDKKALSLYEKANNAMKEHQLNDAKSYLEKAIMRDTNYVDAYFRLGEIAAGQRNSTQATYCYEKTISLAPKEKRYVKAYAYLGAKALETADYTKARDFLDFSLKNTSPSTLFYHQLEKQLKTCNFIQESQKNATTILPKALPAILNSKDKQYFPVFTADNQTIFFTARNDKSDEDIYVSYAKDSIWTSPQSISTTVNTTGNEGTCSISADGRTMVFTACEGRTTLGSCDLFITQKNGENWDAPKHLGKNINSPFWDSQPSLSSDGRCLFFSSDRPGGFGNKDIWISILSPKGEWSKAKNLGANINTSYDEISPFLHANNHTLFFSSNRQIGMGGFDLYMSENENNQFAKPNNLGYPINTEINQSSIFVSANGKEAFYSQDEGKKVNLYTFDVPQNIFQNFAKVNYLKGKILDAKTQKSLRAEIKLIDLNTQKLVIQTWSDSLSGSYVAVLPHGSKYALHISRENYFFKSLSFDYSENQNSEGKFWDIYLEPILKDAKEVLNNIFFDTGKWELRQESYAELDKLVEFLNKNKQIKLQIAGYTDDVGNSADNEILSQKRAESVGEYLFSKGIGRSAFETKGFGEKNPVSKNDTEEGRQQNRRIEVRVL